MGIAEIIYLVLFVISTILSIVLAPKPKRPKVEPGQLDGIPVVDSYSPIPVLFGERIIKQPNVVWYGDVTVEPIKAKAGKK